jgi:hypothetical protein
MNIKQPIFWRLVGAYLKQPIFCPQKPTCWNLLAFIKNERRPLLERCYQLDYEAEIFRVRLEDYWQKCLLNTL